MDPSFIAIIAVIIAIYLLSSIKILAEYERGVIFRLGRVLPQPEGSRRDPGVPSDRPDGAAFAARRSDGGARAGRGHAR